MSEVNFDYVNSRFRYENGRLFWKPIEADTARKRAWNTRFAGKDAGGISPKGRLELKLDGIHQYAHRLIFLLCHGRLPKEIDHIDGNPLNNNIENLREVTRSQNLQNTKTCIYNKSGAKGVWWYPRRNKWVAELKINNKKVVVGHYKSLDDAKAAIRDARVKYHGEYANHG